MSKARKAAAPKPKKKKTPAKKKKTPAKGKKPAKRAAVRESPAAAAALPTRRQLTCPGESR